jgi:hypothetical protein
MSTDNITPAPPVSHNVSLFLQPTGTTENDIEARVDVTESAEYQEIRDLVNLALYHLASSPKAGMVIYSILLNVLVLDCRAADAFATLNGELAIPTQEKAIEDLTNVAATWRLQAPSRLREVDLSRVKPSQLN